MNSDRNSGRCVPSSHAKPRRAFHSLILMLGVALLAACNWSNRDIDEQLRLDLLAASQAPVNRQMYASPMELGYQQGYQPDPRYQPVNGYQRAVYTQPVRQQPSTPARVVYVPAPPSSSGTIGRSSGTEVGGTADNGPGGGNGSTEAGRRQTEKGAIYGAAAGAAIGVLSSRDKAKGAAIGAIGGAVLGGIIGHDVRRP